MTERFVMNPEENFEMIIKDWKKEVFTIPNILSMFRLLLIPVYVAIYLNADSLADYYIAAGILAISCLTDMVDGKIARHFHMISNLGKFLDPLADKMTQFTLTVCLAFRYPILWAIVGLFVIKEVFQLVAVAVNLKKGRLLPGALITGKVCTTILFVSLVLMVLLPMLDMTVIYIITAVDGLFLLVAFIHYVIVFLSSKTKFQSIDDDPNQ